MIYREFIFHTSLSWWELFSLCRTVYKQSVLKRILQVNVSLGGSILFSFTESRDDPTVK